MVYAVAELYQKAPTAVASGGSHADICSCYGWWAGYRESSVDLKWAGVGIVA
jgi:hypothetical protein